MLRNEFGIQGLVINELPIAHCVSVLGRIAVFTYCILHAMGMPRLESTAIPAYQLLWMFFALLPFGVHFLLGPVINRLVQLGRSLVARCRARVRRDERSETASRQAPIILVGARFGIDVHIIPFGHLTFEIPASMTTRESVMSENYKVHHSDYLVRILESIPATAVYVKRPEQLSSEWLSLPKAFNVINVPANMRAMDFLVAESCASGGLYALVAGLSADRVDAGESFPGLGSQPSGSPR
jgi:hypothetical protein